jgi:hypothetical protein
MSEAFYFQNPKCDIPLLDKKNSYYFQEFKTYIFVTLVAQKRGGGRSTAPVALTPPPGHTVIPTTDCMFRQEHSQRQSRNSAPFMETRVHYRVHNSPSGHTHPVPTPPPHLFKTILILSVMHAYLCQVVSSLQNLLPTICVSPMS